MQINGVEIKITATNYRKNTKTNGTKGFFDVKFTIADAIEMTIKSWTHCVNRNGEPFVHPPRNWDGVKNYDEFFVRGVGTEEYTNVYRMMTDEVLESLVKIA